LITRKIGAEYLFFAFVNVLQNLRRKGAGLRAKGIFPAHFGGSRASVDPAPRSTSLPALFFVLAGHTSSQRAKIVTGILVF
jgi:hypothetical protein